MTLWPHIHNIILFVSIKSWVVRHSGSGGENLTGILISIHCVKSLTNQVPNLPTTSISRHRSLKMALRIISTQPPDI